MSVNPVFHIFFLFDVFSFLSFNFFVSKESILSETSFHYFSYGKLCVSDVNCLLVLNFSAQ